MLGDASFGEFGDFLCTSESLAGVVMTTQDKTVKALEFTATWLKGAGSNMQNVLEIWLWRHSIRGVA